ncbi:hypothetical protein HOY82DRAFT_540784 [Tuber indicum]|nr:hypothetical protein HOY82DRAFT_540784 [Tuber indicum]
MCTHGVFATLYPTKHFISVWDRVGECMHGVEQTTNALPLSESAIEIHEEEFRTTAYFLRDKVRNCIHRTPPALHDIKPYDTDTSKSTSQEGVRLLSSILSAPRETTIKALLLVIHCTLAKMRNRNWKNPAKGAKIYLITVKYGTSCIGQNATILPPRPSQLAILLARIVPIAASLVQEEVAVSNKCHGTNRKPGGEGQTSSSVKYVFSLGALSLVPSMPQGQY